MSRIRRNAALSVSLDAVYPVGSVYITTGVKLPASIAAIGTWVQMATGKTLWNVDPKVTVPGTEIEAGLPDHIHTYSAVGYTGSYGRYTRAVWSCGDSGGVGPTVAEFSKASESNSLYGSSDTVQPPAIAVTMWQRTA